MAIKIPSKTEKQRLTLLDGLRILAWTSYKTENQVSGLEGYETFSKEWADSDYVQMDLQKLLENVVSLGYTEQEVLEIRSDYYERRRKVKEAIDEQEATAFASS